MELIILIVIAIVYLIIFDSKKERGIMQTLDKSVEYLHDSIEKELKLSKLKNTIRLKFIDNLFQQIKLHIGFQARLDDYIEKISDYIETIEDDITSAVDYGYTDRFLQSINKDIPKIVEKIIKEVDSLSSTSLENSILKPNSDEISVNHSKIALSNKKNQTIKTALENQNTVQSHIKKVRIYEIIKELDITPKEIFIAANKVGIEVKSHLSVITIEEAEILKKHILDNKTKINETRTTKRSSASEYTNFIKNYNDVKKLQEIVYNWILKEFKRINKLDLSIYPEADDRIKNEAKKVAEELIDKGNSSILLYHIFTEQINNYKWDYLDFVVEDVSFETFGLKATQTALKKAQKSTNDENNTYAKAIQEIQNPTFEKIRRYCNNLVKQDKADTMQTELANNGKMHKAFVYDALEQFIEDLESNKIVIVDWGAGQGIYSSLVVDYIREKQLDIDVVRVVLIDNDTQALKRAKVHVRVLSEKKSEIFAYETNGIDIDIFKDESVFLHIFSNDSFDISLVPKTIYDKEVYCLCVSDTNELFVQETYNVISSYMDNYEVITNRKAKIGRYEKYEVILKSLQDNIFEIDEDEIPF